MKVEVFTPEGRVLLDLTKAKDIKVFGGQQAVDDYINNTKIQNGLRMTTVERLKLIPIEQGGLPADYVDGVI